MAFALILGCTGGADLLRVSVEADAIYGIVGEPVPLEASGIGDLVWFPGDGSQVPGEVVEHVYEAPGHYVASVVGTSSEGRTETLQVPVTVVWEPLVTPPRTSASIATDGETVWAVMPDFDRVAVVDVESRTVLEHLEVCSKPRSVSVLEGSVAVACEGDAIWVDGVTTELDVGSRPFGIVHTDDGVAVTAWLGLWEEGWSGQRDLRGLAWLDGQLLWSQHRSPEDGGRWWIEDVEGVLPADPGPDSDTDARGLPNFLQRIVVNPDGRTAVLPGLKANMERGLVRDGLALTHETTARSEMRHVSLIGEVVPEPAFDNRDLASSAVYSPRGDWLYVAHIGAQIIDVLDPWTMQRAGGVQRIGHGVTGLVAFEDAVWANAEFDRSLVIAEGSVAELRVVEAIDLLGDLDEVLDDEVLYGKKVFYGAADRRMAADSYMSCASCHLDGEHDGRTWDFTSRGEGLRNTKALFGMSGEGPLHWSANFDEVQDFERDIRESMGGSGFINDNDYVDDPFGEALEGLSPELDALAAYLRSLEPPVSPFASNPEGQAIFEASGCGECHYGERLTGSSGEVRLFDVGTLTEESGARLGEELVGLDTPELVGLFHTAPYLHDGSAATLRERFDRDPGGLHGDTSSLSEEQLQALEEYLLSL